MLLVVVESQDRKVITRYLTSPLLAPKQRHETHFETESRKPDTRNRYRPS